MRVWRIIALAAFAATPALAGQGVGDGEVVIGSVSDLSGPFAAFGAPSIKAAQMHFNAVNASGGIHGRKIRFVVEDSSYQMPKALQGYNKLVNRDKVFAMLLSLGTPMNIAGVQADDPEGHSKCLSHDACPANAERTHKAPFRWRCLLLRRTPASGALHGQGPRCVDAMRHVHPDRLRQGDKGRPRR